jgi:hypothetical protein
VSYKSDAMFYTHTHTHTHIYIYIYIYNGFSSMRQVARTGHCTILLITDFRPTHFALCINFFEQIKFRKTK